MSRKKGVFITTTNKNTADKLEANGFKLVRHIGNSWTFMNNKKKFEEDRDEYKECATTDLLSL